LSFYRLAVAVAPRYVKAYRNLGTGLEAAGDEAAAIRCYQTALRLPDPDVYVRYNLGRLLYLQNDHAHAGELLEDAIRLAPEFLDARIVLAWARLAQGDADAAARHFERALERRPDDAGVLRNYGVLLAMRERWTEAERLLRKAVAARNDDAEAHYWLGNALAFQQRVAEAALAYRRAVDLDGGFAEAWCNLGRTLVELGKRDEARLCLARALELQPALADAHVGLGNLEVAEYRLEDAATHYHKAIALAPRNAQAQLNLGNVLLAQGLVPDAAQHYRVALDAAPEYAEARWALAIASIPAMREADADLAALRRAIAQELMHLDEWFGEERVQHAAAAVAIQQPFLLAYQEENNRPLLERHGGLCARLMARWQQSEDLTRAARRRAGPIRLGVVSQYFRRHSVWNALMKGWFSHLDPERFQLAGFCTGVHEDDETRFARSRSVLFVQNAGGTREWARAIRDWQPDVLIYPEIGMDALSTRLAALRLAPVQAASWGHPETSGMPTLDYFLSAELFEPPHAQSFYSERLVALDNLGCWLPAPGRSSAEGGPASVRIDPADRVFVCPGTPFKYAPEHDWVFPAIARRVSGARFFFFTHFASRALSRALERRLEEAFRREALEAARHVRFLSWLEPPEFFELMRRADVFLDTIGFSGFNTAVQAAQCALPIATREGRFMRGRLASGVLRRMGLGDVVAQSEEDYVALAARIATDRDYREALRARMAASQHLLFEDLAPIRALERFLVDAAG
jgi:predicted O-linked N-acetylglucosamine transferase (SPINDLY family)